MTLHTNIKIESPGVNVAVVKKDYDGWKFLVLKRAESESYGGYWGFMTGGKSGDETVAQVVVREMNFMRRDLGQIIVASAILEDTIGWVIIALAFGLAGAGTLDLWTVGRAIVGVGLLASRKIASAEEVRNRQAEQEKPAEAKPKKASTISAKQAAELEPAVRSWLKDHPGKRDEFALKVVDLGVNEPNKELEDVLAQLPNKKAVEELTAWLNANDGK